MRYCNRHTLRCDESPRSVHYHYSSLGRNTPLCCASHLVEILFFVTSLLEQHSIPYFIYWGTLLGSLRHGGLIPWDTDADIGVFPDDRDKLLALPQFEAAGFRFHDKATVGEGFTVYYGVRNELHLDLEIWRRDGDSFTWDNHRLGAAELFPVRRHRFYDRELWGPNRFDSLLADYGRDCLEVGSKKWLYWDTFLWKFPHAEKFRIADFTPASIDLSQDFERGDAIGSTRAIGDRLLSVANRCLWRYRAYWLKWQARQHGA